MFLWKRPNPTDSTQIMPCVFYLPMLLLWQTITMIIGHFAALQFFPHCCWTDLPMVEISSWLSCFKDFQWLLVAQKLNITCMSLEFKPLSDLTLVCFSSLYARALFHEPNCFFHISLPLCLSSNQSLFLGLCLSLTRSQISCHFDILKVRLQKKRVGTVVFYSNRIKNKTLIRFFKLKRFTLFHLYSSSKKIGMIFPNA